MRNAPPRPNGRISTSTISTQEASFSSAALIWVAAKTLFNSPSRSTSFTPGKSSACTRNRAGLFRPCKLTIAATPSAVGPSHNRRYGSAKGPASALSISSTGSACNWLNSACNACAGTPTSSNGCQYDGSLLNASRTLRCSLGGLTS
ncbi:hypothetical protein D3C72_1342250 [compost metagenome]